MTAILAWLGKSCNIHLKRMKKLNVGNVWFRAPRKSGAHKKNLSVYIRKMMLQILPDPLWPKMASSQILLHCSELAPNTETQHQWLQEASSAEHQSRLQNRAAAWSWGVQEASWTTSRSTAPEDLLLCLLKGHEHSPQGCSRERQSVMHGLGCNPLECRITLLLFSNLL